MLNLYAPYPSFQLFLATVVAAVVVLVAMPAFIRLMKRDHIGQQVRDDGPQTHLIKQGTPTMGGLVMLVGLLVAVVLINDFTPATILLLAATLLTGFLGLIDDYSKVRFQNTEGVSPKGKLAVQFLIAIVFVIAAVNWVGVAPTVSIPFVVDIDMGVLTTVLPIGDGISIPWLYVLFVTVLIAGMSNATNLTDGLDGLASGTVMVVMLFMAIIAYRSDMLDVSIFAGALCGACIGFLWFNAYPADIFMGDTGSLALGTALACLAVLTKTEVLSLVMGGLFVAEALSVMIQVFYYKRTKKRIFLMAPLHHHFEKKGWSEVKVVIRFWIVSGTLAAIGFIIYFAESLVEMGV
ncbi:phospho-N-acetylmuramoyl-pentapeptide-transferase [Denitrobacterium detoxificans]|jgi:phospho-N-acetylmuramoyl-pentapeptide-transferase|uniref:phospho-N-acetylmuramoyl-pentapeptide- transferase n=1 Tax=Denitrobacterium detoxificans TaxID=79604 RepID=UPI0026F0A482|nr:phospho-N-acetylmuramoyl-pentapeptide-transferase [Denitrobacterium detoxificans]MBE6465877.1 phospho-N-acetylmuramoyl-pentapeptide-transferase [Denitrobacterium detoxificans]